MPRRCRRACRRATSAPTRIRPDFRAGRGVCCPGECATGAGADRLSRQRRNRPRHEPRPALYRVRVGPVASEAEARRLLAGSSTRLSGSARGDNSTGRGRGAQPEVSTDECGFRCFGLAAAPRWRCCLRAHPDIATAAPPQSRAPATRDGRQGAARAGRCRSSGRSTPRPSTPWSTRSRPARCCSTRAPTSASRRPRCRR